MADPKKHHFVPQMLLNNFVDEQGKLHWCDLTTPKTEVKPTNPAAFFFQTHLYSLISDKGEKDVVVEKELAELESSAAPIIAKIVQLVRNGSPVVLEEREKSVWYTFLLMQWKRTPESQQAVATDEDLAESFDAIVADVKEMFPERIAEINLLSEPNERKRQIRNIRVAALRNLSVKIMEIFAQRGIAILKIVNSDKSFLIGSRPVVKLKVAGESNLENPIVELWLPIAPDIAIGIGRSTAAVEVFELTGDRPIRQLNLAIAGQSRFIASRSPDLVFSISKRFKRK